MKDSTRLIRAGLAEGPMPKTVNPSIQRGSTVLMPTAADLYDDSQITYGLEGLESHIALRQALAGLEAAEHVSLYPSGLAALTGAMLALLKTGDEILVTDGTYGPTRRFCDNTLARMGISTRYFEADAPANRVAAMITSETRLVIVEAPASLTFEMQDIPAISAVCRQAGVLTLIDNTWAAGLLFKPLNHGIDISMQALTKYVGGHADTLMGSLAIRDPNLGEQIGLAHRELGWGTAPEDAWMMLRGLRTLPLRLQRHGEHGLTVAHWLASHSMVRQVLHPAMPGAPGHALWQRDFSGAAGVFGFVLQPGPESAVFAFLDALQLFGLGFSWGSYESLAIHADPQFGKRKYKPALGGPVIRLSIGLEDPPDLIADLEQALGLYAQQSGHSR